MGILRWFWNRVQLQPVATGTLVRSSLVMGTAFGLNLTTGQLATVYPWIEMVIMWLTFSAVTPTKTADARVAAALATPAPGQ